MNKLFLVLGGGAVLYWWYSKQQPATAPAAQAPATGTPAPQPTVPAPQPGNVTVTPPSSTPPVTTPTPFKGTALQAAYLAIQDHAKQDPTLLDATGTPHATFSQWNWYLMTYGGQADLPAYYDATGGQTDPNTPMRAEQYWTIMFPWLKANRGLSGLGAYAPAYRRRAAHSVYLGPGGWLA